jgi:5-methylcytosine-specific restriction enzyme A
MLDARDLQRAVQTRFDVAFAVERLEKEGEVFYIRPADVPPTIGFAVEIQIGWRSLEAQFIPGPFAAELVQAMEHSDAQQRIAFRAFASAAVAAGANLTFKINSVPCDPISESWPSDWKSCDIRMRRSNIHWRESSTADDESIRAWACRFLGLIVALLPLESMETTTVGEAEGNAIEVVSKRYERSRLNRAACIEIQGSRCLVCGFDFRETYGPIGEGFIHVHHVVSVSTVGPGTVINPARDLIPVCPNCHAMLHTSRPPVLPEILRQILRKRVSA